MILIYNVLITAILFALLLVCLWNFYILRKKKYNKLHEDSLPFISVLVPARNEELNIKEVLVSLLEQDYPNYELIVLNDNSEDNTPAIIDELKIKYPKLKSINGKPLEEGWTGKCFACKQLYEASKGEYILFTDADTRHFPNSLRDAITIAISREAGMLTLIPLSTMVSFPEKLLMPMLWFTLIMLLPMYFVEKKGFVKFSAGIGPFMLFKRKAYEEVGGHESVKSALVEDVWLARKIKEHGLKLVLEDGCGILSVRMYRGFKDIWNGFSKNIFAGFEYSTITLIAVNTMYMLLFFLPFILFSVELSSHNSFTELTILTGIQVFILYFARFLMSIRFSLGILSAILHPFAVIMVPIIAANSWKWIRMGKGAAWKGRVYAKGPKDSHGASLRDNPNNF